MKLPSCLFVVVLFTVACGSLRADESDDAAAEAIEKEVAKRMANDMAIPGQSKFVFVETARIDIKEMIVRDNSKEGKPIIRIGQLGFYVKSKDTGQERFWSLAHWIRDDLLKKIGACKQLRELNLDRCDWITDVGLFHLTDCKHLESLSLNDLGSNTKKITEDGLKELAAFKKLKRLSIVGFWTEDKVTDGVLKELGRCEALEVLKLRGKYTYNGLRHLIDLKKLVVLEADEPMMGTDELRELAKLKNLRTLRISVYGSATEEALKGLISCEELESLSLSTYYSNNQAKITSAVLKGWSAYKNLKALELRGCERIQDTALKELLAFQHLEYLDLGSCKKLTDSGIKEVAGCKRLRKLSVYGCSEITNTGLIELSSCEKLEELDIRRCPRVTPLGVAKIRKALPKLSVQVDSTE